MRLIQRATAMSVLSAALFCAPSVRAQAAPNKITAEALFEEGRRLMADGKTADACEKFASSQQADPSSGTLLNLANCYEKLGRSATAWATYKAAASLASTTGRSDHLSIAQKRSAAIGPRLPRLSIAPTTPVDGLEITCDGVVVNRSEWGMALPVDPGAHTCGATAPRHKPWTSTFDVANKTGTLPVTVPTLDDAPESEPPASPVTSSAPEPVSQAAPNTFSTGASSMPSSSDTQSSGLGARRSIAIALAAGSVAALTVGTVFLVSAKSKYDSSLASCPNDKNMCAPAGVALRNDARAAGNVATVAFVVGGAALAAGAVLWLTAPPSNERGGPERGARERGARRSGVAIVPMYNGAMVRGQW